VTLTFLSRPSHFTSPPLPSPPPSSRPLSLHTAAGVAFVGSCSEGATAVPHTRSLAIMGCGSSRNDPPKGSSNSHPRRRGSHASLSSADGSSSSASNSSDSRSCALSPAEEQKRMQRMRALPRGGRRTSIYSESIVPSSEGGGEYKKVVHKKPAASAAAIAKVLATNILFKDLREDLMQEVIDAMFEKKVRAGTELIKQGDTGDYFYILGRGVVEVFVSGANVLTIEKGGSFGELALLYNAPRAATCKTSTDCVVWGLDRMTFKRTLVNSDDQRRRLYLQLLQRIPLFAEMTLPELRNVAQVLQPRTFQKDEVILRQGDKGKRFFILETGRASVRQTKGNGPEIELAIISSGDYFGEIALVNRQRRAATVVALEKTYTVSLDRDAFVRLLGRLRIS
ncbi:cAMP-dependent protein kinase regulatory subunit, partial [Thecamonas trahens ATCC 50062]